MASTNWTAADIPDSTGKTVIVTGANSGIGYASTKQLAEKGAHVVMACRSADRADAARRKLESEVENASLDTMELDLASLDSVAQFAAAFTDRYSDLDVLVNNAGVMIPPFSKTEEGFELQFGVNFIGHFALTGQLLPMLLSTPDSRVVTLSSLAHRRASIDFDNFRGEKSYSQWREYGQSKLADLMFALELQRQLDAHDAGTRSLAAHPGFTRTNLQRHSSLTDFGIGFFSMDQDQGALPTLYAATAPDAQAGGYYGPDGWFEIRGYPEPAKISTSARDEQVAIRLWEYAAEATGVTFFEEGDSEHDEETVEA
ncbi:oxidoreductase [Haladaptatus sp. ZSTT2]|uniref:oxidoreductase n=1 Tax=Haladaptatus sp. ZSTT2 TaxID=3120515 RepID=UPI00300E88A7